MSEVFITRKGGGGKASAPELLITDVGGSWIEFEVTNTDQSQPAQIFLLANYDPNSEEDFDILAVQNGKVVTVNAGETATEFIQGLDASTTHTISAQAAVIKKLPSNIVTTDPTDLLQTGVPAPTVGPLVENNLTSTVVSVKNNELKIPLIIKAVATTSTAVPSNYPFETSSLGPDTSTSLTITGISPETTYYIHARAFDGDIQSANVVFGPYTTPVALETAVLNALGNTNRTLTSETITVDCRGLTAATTGTMQIIARGGKGGNSSGATGANGWTLNGNVPYTSLENKIIAFVGGGNGNNATRGSRDAGAGGGFSGIIQLNPTGFQQLRTLTHIFTAGGGGGAGTNANGQVNSSLLTSNNSVTPSVGGASLHKNSSGSTGSYPGFNWAQRPGNAWGGGDSATNSNGDDNFQGGGGGGFGPLPGGASNNTSGPGVLSGIPAATPHGFYQNVTGGYGGGGTGSGGGNGGTAWRVSSSGGGGGGFQSGSGGGFVGDASSRGGFGGCAYSLQGSWVTSSNSTGSTSGSLQIIL